MSTEPNGWSRQEEAAVMYRLDELSADMLKLNQEVVKMREHIAALKGQDWLDESVQGERE